MEPEVMKQAFWAHGIEEVLLTLETQSEGLSSDEAQRRLKLFKKNALPERSRATSFGIFTRQFKNPLILLLIVASGITYAISDLRDALFILVAVLVNIVLGFYQENKAESALAHLQSYVRDRAKVFRDGIKIEIDASELVPGDVVYLMQGDRVSADARILYANDLSIDESVLTGESLPTQKQLDPVSADASLGDQKSMVFSGTLVGSGFGRAVVCRTGQASEMGKIVTYVAQSRSEETPLQKAILKFSIRTSLFLLALTGILFAIGLWRGQSIFEMFITSVAITVSAIPEGLPVAMTVILAIGVQRLAKKKGIVRKLLAAETLGSTTMVLTDKTGTLTEGKMSLAQVVSMVDGEDAEETMLQYALLAADVTIENPNDAWDQWRVNGRPLEVALVYGAAERDVRLPVVQKAFPALHYVPFNSRNKYSAVALKDDNTIVASLFGAPEVLLAKCDLSDTERKKILETIDRLAYSGEYVLGMATKHDNTIQEAKLKDSETLTGFTFTGLISFRDRIRPEVREAMDNVRHAGVKVVIVTGDHRGTAEAVAQQLNFDISEGRVIEGGEVDRMSDEELQKRLPHVSVVARVSPEGKLRIATAFQALGETVAMTGDGINDVVSLKKADIGIAMGSGTDVARDVADLVLLDNNFSTIVSAIEEGRRALGNIRKVIVYLFSSIFDELVLIGGALIFGLALPLNALQILWVNFITDSFPAIGLGFENGVDYLRARYKKGVQSLLDYEVKFLILAIGITTSVLLFALYAGLLWYGFDPLLVRTFIFAAFGSYTLFLIFSIKDLTRPIYQYNFFSNVFLLTTVAIGMIMMVISLYIPFFNELLDTVPLPLPWLFAVIVVGICNIIAVEFGKWLLHRRA